MESVFKIIKELIASRALEDSTFLIIIITLIFLIIIGFLLYKTIVKPLFLKISTFPSISQINKLIKNYSSKESSTINFHIIMKKLDKINETIKSLKNSSNYSKSFEKKVEIDIDYIKQVLNQFQGHFMYSQKNRNNFGNKELK